MSFLFLPCHVPFIYFVFLVVCVCVCVSVCDRENASALVWFSLFPGFSYFVMPYLKDVFLKCVCFIIWKYNWFFGILILYSAVLLDSYQFSCRCADLPRTVVAPWEMALLSVPCCHSGFYWMRSFWSIISSFTSRAMSAPCCTPVNAVCCIALTLSCCICS